MKITPRIFVRAVVYTALALCFVPFYGGSYSMGDITGSTTHTSDMFFVTWRTSTAESPLKKWSNDHHLDIAEEFVLLGSSSHSLLIIGDNFGGPRPAIQRFYRALQDEYVRREDESAIRQFLTAMMNAQNETERQILVKGALMRVSELTGIDPKEMVPP